MFQVNFSFKINDLATQRGQFCIPAMAFWSESTQNCILTLPNQQTTHGKTAYSPPKRSIDGNVANGLAID
jgi:hypothetical protein